MTDQPLTKQKKNARKKGLAALGSAATTVAFTLMAGSWGFLVPGIPLTIWLTYRWLAYRAEWGMKF